MVHLALALGVFALQASAKVPSTFEPHALASIPEGIELVGPPIVDPDGVEQENRSTVVWSPDGSHAAYVGFKGQATHPVLDDAVGEAWTYLSAPVFDWSGEHVAFRAGRRTAPQEESWGVLVDGVDGERLGVCAWIGEVAFSPDGEELVWWEQPGARLALGGFYTRSVQRLVRAKRSKDEWKLSRGKEWDDVQSLERPRFAADGETVVAIVQRTDGWLVLGAGARRERELTKKLPWIQAFDCDARGKRVALAYRDDRKGFELPDLTDPAALTAGSLVKLTIHVGKEVFGDEAESASCPSFDPLGKRLAYKILFGGKMDVSVEGLGANARFDHVCAPRWSPDGRELAYVAVDGPTESSEWLRMSPVADWQGKGGRWTGQGRAADPKESSKQLGPAALEIRDLVWNDDGERLAWRARGEDGWRIVAVTLPGMQVTTGEVADEVGPPRFSADGRKLAHGARRGREPAWRALELSESAGRR